MAAWSGDKPLGAPAGRKTHIDWAAVYAWAAAVGLCLAVWTGVFLLIWQGWHV